MQGNQGHIFAWKLLTATGAEGHEVIKLEDALCPGMGDEDLPGDCAYKPMHITSSGHRSN